MRTKPSASRGSKRIPPATRGGLKIILWLVVGIFLLFFLPLIVVFLAGVLFQLWPLYCLFGIPWLLGLWVNARHKDSSQLRYEDDLRMIEEKYSRPSQQ